jgi:hypothetical protein
VIRRKKEKGEKKIKEERREEKREEERERGWRKMKSMHHHSLGIHLHPVKVNCGKEILGITPCWLFAHIRSAEER